MGRKFSNLAFWQNDAIETSNDLSILTLRKINQSVSNFLFAFRCVACIWSWSGHGSLPVSAFTFLSRIPIIHIYCKTFTFSLDWSPLVTPEICVDFLQRGARGAGDKFQLHCRRDVPSNIRKRRARQSPPTPHERRVASWPGFTARAA